jgi:O-antigen/teichoic acid export membrane protein
VNGDRAQDAAAVGEWTTSSAVVLRGGAWNVFSRVVPHLYTLVISIAAARFLGAEGFGRQSFISFVSLSIVFFLTTGVSAGLIRYIGDAIGRERPGDVGRLIRWGWLVELVAALGGSSVLIVAAAAGADPRAAWLFAAVGCFVGVLHAVPSAILGGLQLWRAATIVGVVSGLITALASVAVLAAGGGISGMFAVEAAGSIVNLAGTTLLARRAMGSLPATAPGAGTASSDLLRSVVRFSLASSYGVLLYLIVWRRSEFFFLEHFVGDVAVAIYSVPFAAVAALIQIPEAFGAVVLPAFATLAGAQAQERIRSGFARALRLILLATLPTTAAALALGPALLEAVWGAEFEESGPVLLVMAAPLPVIALLYVSKALAAGLGKLRFVLIVETGAALLNVSLALLLIPPHGALGAAVAHATAQVASAVPILMYALRLAAPVRWRPSAILPAAGASAGAGLLAGATLVLVEGALGLALASVVGTAAFAVLAVMLRILPPEDAAWLETHGGPSVARLSRLVTRPAVRAA